MPTLGLAIACFAGAPAAQGEWMGLARAPFVVEGSAYSRNNLGGLAGEVMTRLDSKEHAGWGTAIPGFRAVNGVAFATTRGPTPQTIDVLLYPESGNNTNLPAAAATIFALALPLPGGPWQWTLTGPPAMVPIAFTGDVFLSFRLPAPPFPGWPTDGVGLGIVAGYGGTLFDDFPLLTNYDNPGYQIGAVPFALANKSYGLRKTLGAAYVDTRQHWFDLKQVPWAATPTNPGAGGVGIVWNAQATYPSGAGGTSNFLSGTSPHVYPPGINGNLATRNDDIGMGIQMAGLGGQMVVHVVQVGGTFGVESPITLSPVFAAPGSTGVLCLDQNWAVTHVVVDFGVGTTAEVLYSPDPNPSYAGIPVVQQSFVFDIGTGLIHASPCDRMVL